MIKFFSRKFSRRWLYPFICGSAVIFVLFGSPLTANAIPWLKLIQNGLQFGQASGMSEKQEVKLGKNLNDQLLATKYRLYQNPELERYVNEVGQRVAAHSDRPNLPYTFQIVEEPSINAFATLGGFVYVHTGLLRAADNEAQLAGVLGHETGHINAKHFVHRIQKAAVERGLLSLAGVDQNALVNIGLNLAIVKPSNRDQESEADTRGMQYIGRTGYPQSQMPAFMKKMLSAHNPPTFLSDHPGTAERVKAMQKNIDSTLPQTSMGMDSAAYKVKVHMLL